MYFGEIKTWYPMFTILIPSGGHLGRCTDMKINTMASQMPLDSVVGWSVLAVLEEIWIGYTKIKHGRQMPWPIIFIWTINFVHRWPLSLDINVCHSCLRYYVYILQFICDRRKVIIFAMEDLINTWWYYHLSEPIIWSGIRYCNWFDLSVWLSMSISQQP